MNHHAAILALSALAGVLIGCQSPQAAQPVRASLAPQSPPYEQYSRQSPYAVLDAPGMRYAPVESDAVNPTPWWYDRNDARLNLRTSSSTMDSMTYTIQQIDRQQVSGGRVYDNYQRNVYSWRVGRLGP